MFYRLPGVETKPEKDGYLNAINMLRAKIMLAILLVKQSSLLLTSLRNVGFEGSDLGSGEIGPCGASLVTACTRLECPSHPELPLCSIPPEL